MTVTLEEQLASLEAAGLVVNPDVTEGDLTSAYSRADIEREPYQALIDALGIDVEREPFTPVCDRLWLCDYERIEDHGDYCDVVHRLERMTGEALGISNVTDHVDLETDLAWVEFDLDGKRQRWNLRVDNDWLDPQVFTRYDDLLEAAGVSTRLYLNQTDYGQEGFLGAFTPEQKAAFDRLTRVKLPPLSRQ